MKLRVILCIHDKHGMVHAVGDAPGDVGGSIGMHLKRCKICESRSRTREGRVGASVYRARATIVGRDGEARIVMNRRVGKIA